MIAYASGLFFWGWLGDRLNPKHVIVTGMIGSAISLTLFGAVPKWSGYYNVAYYVFFYILFGLMQACGWPSEIAIMANWFGKANRGFVMGVWASCQPLGNVFGSYFTSWVLPFGYENTFFLNGLLLLVGAFVVMISIDPKPRETPYSHLNDVEQAERSREGEPISLINAILLPGVLAYCLCNACLKLVNYAFFFWLPLFLTEAYHWEETKTSLGWESVFYLFMMLNTLAIACIMKRCLMDLKPLANETWSFDLKNDESDAFILLVCLSFLVCR
ncbi:MFS domain-containing protein [Trichostrongylus colubriformis]|uniref:MFS domain-containing protein n=1 Tax=Trichostrongylus colubriformis TaxID=6319 RepID=A0AAN8IKN9_TRICO